MLRELLRVLRGPENPITEMSRDFSKMLTITYAMTLTAGELFFDRPVDPAKRSQLYDEDVEVNKLERRLRKRLVAHLSVSPSRSDIPYAMLLMSLVKDVERIGDYAKNLSEVTVLHPDPLPDDELLAELREIRRQVEPAFDSASHIFEHSDQDKALGLIRTGRGIATRCDSLVTSIAGSKHDARTATALALGTRFYKRIGGHVLNVLSSVVMPLHKIDYFDEDEITLSEAEDNDE